jgi:hypothetical protein
MPIFNKGLNMVGVVWLAASLPGSFSYRVEVALQLAPQQAQNLLREATEVAYQVMAKSGPDQQYMIPSILIIEEGAAYLESGFLDRTGMQEQQGHLALGVLPFYGNDSSVHTVSLSPQTQDEEEVPTTEDHVHGNEPNALTVAATTMTGDGSVPPMVSTSTATDEANIEGADVEATAVSDSHPQEKTSSHSAGTSDFLISSTAMPVFGALCAVAVAGAALAASAAVLVLSRHRRW